MNEDPSKARRLLGIATRFLILGIIIGAILYLILSQYLPRKDSAEEAKLAEASRIELRELKQFNLESEFIREIAIPAMPQAKKVVGQTGIVETIKRVAKEEGVDPNLLIAIAKCESSLRPGARGRVDKRDRGLYQISSLHNPEVSDECAFDVECSTRWVARQIKSGNLWKWKASSKCWKPLVQGGAR
jgi:hypothetical protein